MLVLQSPLLNADPYGSWCLFLVRSWSVNNCYSRVTRYIHNDYYHKSTQTIERLYPSNGYFTSYETYQCWEDGCCSAGNWYRAEPYTYAICDGAILDREYVSYNNWRYKGWNVNFADNNLYTYNDINGDYVSGFINSRLAKKNEKISLLDYLKWLNWDYETLGNGGNVGNNFDGYGLWRTYGFYLAKQRTILIRPRKR